jgi:hypothetical protein
VVKKPTERKIHALLLKNKKSENDIYDSHLELRTRTEITKNYNLTLTTLVRVTRKYVDIPRSLKEETEEEEIYRMGFENTAKATEMHKQIVDVITHLNDHNLLSVSFR